jgi:RNA polymerase sigma factor (sigma-70 family)
MKYKYVIQELKESGDVNVQAFLKDVEKMKPMSRKDRDHCLQTRFMHESVQKLVEEFIPFIIMVAYGYSTKVRTLTLLDLINEGILGAYDAFKNSNMDGRLTRKRVLNSIKRRIYNAIKADEKQCVADYYFDVCVPEGALNDEGMVMDIDRGNVRRLLRDMLEINMSARDAGIIYEYYFGKDDDYEMIAAKYGLTRERVRQIVKNVGSLDYPAVKALKKSI